MEALRKISPLRARVVRDGREQLVAARDLVPGDVLLLAAGDAVGAETRLLEGAEAALTDESLSVAKHAEQLLAETLLADHHNMFYSGTHIAAGRGHAVVATGTRTEVGRIANCTEAAVEPERRSSLGSHSSAAMSLLALLCSWWSSWAWGCCAAFRLRTCSWSPSARWFRCLRGRLGQGSAQTAQRSLPIFLEEDFPQPLQNNTGWSLSRTL